MQPRSWCLDYYHSSLHMYFIMEWDTAVIWDHLENRALVLMSLGVNGIALSSKTFYYCISWWWYKHHQLYHAFVKLPYAPTQTETHTRKAQLSGVFILPLSRTLHNGVFSSRPWNPSMQIYTFLVQQTLRETTSWMWMFLDWSSLITHSSAVNMFWQLV